MSSKEDFISSQPKYNETNHKLYICAFSHIDISFILSLKNVGSYTQFTGLRILKGGVVVFPGSKEGVIVFDGLGTTAL